MPTTCSIGNQKVRCCADVLIIVSLRLVKYLGGLTRCRPRTLHDPQEFWSGSLDHGQSHVDTVHHSDASEGNGRALHKDGLNADARLSDPTLAMQGTGKRAHQAAEGASQQPHLYDCQGNL